jgi:hypothetical protein
MKPTKQFDALEAAIKLGRDPRLDSSGIPTLEHLRRLRCKHEGYNFDEHGRRCPSCGALIQDWGD